MGPTSREVLPQKEQVVIFLPRKPLPLPPPVGPPPLVPPPLGPPPLGPPPDGPSPPPPWGGWAEEPVASGAGRRAGCRGSPWDAESELRGIRRLGNGCDWVLEPIHGWNRGSVIVSGARCHGFTGFHLPSSIYRHRSVPNRFNSIWEGGSGRKPGSRTWRPRDFRFRGRCPAWCFERSRTPPG